MRGARHIGAGHHPRALPFKTFRTCWGLRQSRRAVTSLEKLGRVLAREEAPWCVTVSTEVSIMSVVSAEQPIREDREAITSATWPEQLPPAGARQGGTRQAAL